MKTKRFAPIIMLLFTLLAPLACHKETEEDRVRNVVTSVQKAAENKDVRGVLDYLSASYRDPRGNDREGIRGILVYYFFRHSKVSAYIPDIEVTINDTTASASFQAVLTGRTGEALGKVIPEALGVYAFTVTMTKEEGRWRVVSAEWNRTGEGLVEPPS